MNIRSVPPWLKIFQPLVYRLPWIDSFMLSEPNCTFYVRTLTSKNPCVGRKTQLRKSIQCMNMGSVLPWLKHSQSIVDRLPLIDSFMLSEPNYTFYFSTSTSENLCVGRKTQLKEVDSVYEYGIGSPIVEAFSINSWPTTLKWLIYAQQAKLHILCSHTDLRKPMCRAQNLTKGSRFSVWIWDRFPHDWSFLNQ